MIQRKSKSLATCLAAAILTLSLAACGDKPEPAGPDVRGMSLPTAKTVLKKVGVTTSVHAKDALFGVLIASNFVVCDEEAINAHMVRLEVAKHGC